MTEAIRLTMIGAALTGVAASIYIIARALHKCHICEEWRLSCRPTEWGYQRRKVSACEECREMRVLVREVYENDKN